MKIDLAQQRQEAHFLLDGLPEDKLLAVRHLLQLLAERNQDQSMLSRSLANAPVEEEDLTPETMAAINRAAASFDRGEGISHEEFCREFGL